MFVCLFVCRDICLFVYLFVFAEISVYLFVCLFVCLFAEITPARCSCLTTTVISCIVSFLMATLLTTALFLTSIICYRRRTKDAPSPSHTGTELDDVEYEVINEVHAISPQAGSGDRDGIHVVMNRNESYATVMATTTSAN